MWLYDRLFNRKIEGKSSLDNLEPLVAKVEYEGDKVKINADVQVEGLTSKGIANTGALANIGDVAVSGNGSFTGTVTAQKVSEEGDTELIDLTPYVNSVFAKSNTLYAKLLVKHGTLHIIVSGNVICAGNVATNMILLNNFIEAIPESIRSRIYRGEGTNITQTPLAQGVLYNGVCGVVGFRNYSGAASNVQPFLLSSNQANELTLQLRPVVALSEDVDLFLDCRVTLTI